jgi:hypothetical protein
MTSITNDRESLTSTSERTGSMPSASPRRWAARILFAVPVLFLLIDGVMKLILPTPVVEAMPTLGWPVSLARPLGVILLVSLAVYVVPRTTVLGAILLTGYLGGAIATHVRIGNPLATHILFPVYLAVMLWGALYLRDARLRALLSFRVT